MLWIVYNLLFPPVFLLMLPKFLTRMVRRGGYGRHFEQRLGFFGSGTRAKLKAAPRVWVHAVSVGEIRVALRFMQAWRACDPGVRFALSTTTSTGHAIAERELDERDVLFYFPVDLPMIVRKVLKIVGPVRIVLVEGEYWPNLVRLAHRRGVAVSVINGRMSERSWRGYRKLRPLMRDVLGMIDPICVRGEADARRLVDLGAAPERTHVVGSVKFDVATRDPAAERRAREALAGIGVPEDAIVLLGGSTWPGEEDVLCGIYKRLRGRYPNLFLVLVPRHVERAPEVVRCLERHGLSYARRGGGEAPGALPDALFVDTTGELAGFYAAADVVFVGKSLCARGGQNPIEPAACGRPTIVGPHMENFPAVMPALLDAGAVRQVKDAEELEAEIGRLVGDSEARNAQGARAAEAVEGNRGAIRRTLEKLRTEAGSAGT